MGGSQIHDSTTVGVNVYYIKLIKNDIKDVTKNNVAKIKLQK